MWAARLPAVLALLALAAPALAVDADADARYAKVRDQYLALKEDAQKQKFRHHYLRVIDDFDGFVRAHPDHAKAPSALYNAARLGWDLYKVSRLSSDLRRSRRMFDRLVASYPQDSLADDAQFLVGRILFEHGGGRTDAYRAFDSVVQNFPDSDMAPEAREMLTVLSAHRPEDAGADSQPPRRLIARSTSWRGTVGKPAAVNTLKSWTHAESTRVAVYLDGPFAFRERELAAQEGTGTLRRFYVDLKNARLSEEVPKTLLIEDGSILQVRSGQFSDDTVRVVLDLLTDARIRVTAMENPYRLVIEMARSGLPVGGGPLPNLARVAEGVSVTPEVPLSVQAGLRIRRVVIDAGHGGYDKGAVGKKGLREKDVALAISKRLGRRLERHGLEVVYTRTDDTFVELEERTSIANAESADLFVSVHANAHPRRDRKGVSTYYLDITHDRYSMRLAARENEGSGRSINDLQFILADLLMKSNVDDSARLASEVQRSSVGRLREGWSGVRDLGVKSALFFVLLGARMPAILVETSFISNPGEEQRLKTEKYQDAIAEGIFRGIVAFIEDRKTIAMGNQ